MTRKKVKLAFIVNDAARKATYKKRKKGLLKKVDELSTLCGIEACAILYGPYDPQPEIWPSPWGVERALSKFRTMPEMEQSKKMMNQETFMRQRVLKTKEQVKKQRKENREKETTLLMFQCLNEGKIVHNNMTMVDLNDLSWLIDQNLKNIGRKLEAEDNNNNNINNNNNNGQIQIMDTPNQLVELAPLPSKNEELPPMGHPHVGLGMSNGDNIMQRQWIMDLMINGNGNGNGDEINIPFGDANVQSGFWPNLLS
ncbi:agamous-like MADS-box protein AGL80 [Cicer arietinum]|uniref:Agamous-like MADS-box protein AGL80 n=1 Tax=Cicer arietinum TaxID=3827 RepID=A0A1S2Y776_CICAR|nr:agamous-like MADS-box protein AGL80 [Cicer arietinum]